MEHPIPFHKATDLGKVKKLASQNAPDLDDAFEVRDGQTFTSFTFTHVSLSSTRRSRRPTTTRRTTTTFRRTSW
jgi:hypothetical protein